MHLQNATCFMLIDVIRHTQTVCPSHNSSAMPQNPQSRLKRAKSRSKNRLMANLVQHSSCVIFWRRICYCFQILQVLNLG